MRLFGGLILVVVGALGAWLPASTTQARSQKPGRPTDRSAAPTRSADAILPDIAGFRPGMAYRQALSLLQAHDPKGHIEVGQVAIAELDGKRFPATLLLTSTPVRPGSPAPEIVQLEITLPPERPVVWGILRRLFFDAGKEMTRTDLLAALRQKYGRETSGISVPIVNLYWTFDEQGGRVETGSGTNCTVPGPWDLTPKSGSAAAGTRSSTFAGSSLLLARPAQNQGPCKPLVYVKALLQPSGRRGLELIEATTVAVIDGALAARSQAATSAYLANATKAKKEDARKK